MHDHGITPDLGLFSVRTDVALLSQKGTFSCFMVLEKKDSLHA